MGTNRILKDIKAVVFDFDGVFTDNRVLISEDGVEHVICTRADGLGLERLKRLKIPMAIISSETNLVVAKRAKKLGLPAYHGLSDKTVALKSFVEELTIDLKQVAYLGNDINDEDCLKMVGVPVIVADSVSEIRPLAKIILSKNGGDGAVRELCDMIWDSQKQEGQ